MSSQKALIVLQENSGKVPLPNTVSNSLHDVIYNVIDQLAETFENIKITLQSTTHYDVVHLLTDNLCTHSRLLYILISETKKKSRK